MKRQAAAVPRNDGAISAALAERRPEAFARALQAMDKGNSGIPFAERAGILGRVELLADFYLALSQTGGLRLFLDTPEGNGFRKLVFGCRVIDAPKTERLLAAVAALYPRGRVPRDEGDRLEATSEIDHSRSIAERVDPFVRIQRAHRGAAAELIARLRPYVRKHASALATGLAQAERARLSRATAFRAAKKAAGGKRAGNSSSTARPTLRNEPPRKAKAARPAATQPAAVVPTYPARIDADAIIAGLSRLDAKGWLALVEHWIANARRLNEAIGDLSSALADVVMGRRFPRAEVEDWMEEGRRVWEPAERSAEAVPETVRLNGKAIPFRRAALRIKSETRNAAMLYPLLLDHNEQRPAMTILGPVLRQLGL